MDFSSIISGLSKAAPAISAVNTGLDVANKVGTGISNYKEKVKAARRAKEKRDIGMIDPTDDIARRQAGMVTSDENLKDVIASTKESLSGVKGTDEFNAVKQFVNSTSDTGKSFSGAEGQGISKSLGNLNRYTNVGSDENLKDIFGEDAPIDAFSKINAYMFKYKPEAQKLYQGKNHIDDEEHFGVMAQELAKNPLTESTVKEDENGFLMVDTAQLTMTNTAMISQLARKVQELESKLGGNK